MALRYVELGGQFRRVLSVVKLRASAHSKDIRFFDIDKDSIRIGAPLTQYASILTGHPDWRLLQCSHASELPALRWKLGNLQTFSQRRASGL